MGINEELKSLLEGDILFLGLGNMNRGDDSIGISLVEDLTDEIKNLKTNTQIKALTCGKNPEFYIKDIVEYDPDTIILIDSVNFGENPGKLIITDPDSIKSRSVSSHRMPIPIFIEIIKEKIDKLKVHLIGIQPSNIEIGSSISDEVYTSGKRLKENILKVLKTSKI